MTNAYLLEIGLEEMPASMIQPALTSLEKQASQFLKEAQLEHQSLQGFCTPRRLAILIQGLPEKQPDQHLEIKGPPETMAKDDAGNWSKAALGFAKKNAIAPEELSIKDFDGKPFLMAEKEILGRPTQEVLGAVVAEWITNISFPKNMRWGTYKMRYIRPIRWIASLWNDTLLPLSLEMVDAQTKTQGHRFLSPEFQALPHAESYENHLQQHCVIADSQKRRDTIVEQIQQLEEQHQFHVTLDESLLAEVNQLVEWPTAFVGHFEESFLEVPTEVLVTSMATHQRYFPVYDQQQRLLPCFVGVRNGNSQGIDTVAKGNEKVLRARLSDAQFFYQEDQKKPLSFFQKQSDNVVFFQKRGSLAQRVARLQEIGGWIAQSLNWDAAVQKDVQRIAELSKFDLQTQMVYEFTDLQGVMGRYYAQKQGESEVVAQGIEEHYAPQSTQGPLPQVREAWPVAIADKIDLMTTAFSLGKIPTGSADPYALRRMAQGIVQIVLQEQLPLSLPDLIQKSVQCLNQQQSLGLDENKLAGELLQFLQQRERFLMKEAGLRHDVIEAVQQSTQLCLTEQHQLAEALTPHLESDVFKRATEAIIRAKNIYQKNQDAVPQQLQESQLEGDAETALWGALKPLMAQPIDVSQYLEHLFALEPQITRFFDDVLIMDPDEAKRQNRLFLCQHLSQWSQCYLDLKTLQC